MTTTVAKKAKGLSSTRETWGVAVKYVSERKRIEEALGFIIQSGQTAREMADLQSIVQKMKKMAARVQPVIA